MSILKKMKKQWWEINKNNIEDIIRKKEIESLLKLLKELGLKPTKQ